MRPPPPRFLDLALRQHRCAENRLQNTHAATPTIVYFHRLLPTTAHKPAGAKSKTKRVKAGASLASDVQKATKPNTQPKLRSTPQFPLRLQWVGQSASHKQD